MCYSRKPLNCLERIIFFYSTRMMSMVDLIDISVETPRLGSECYLEKEFIKLIHMNTQKVLYLIVN